MKSIFLTLLAAVLLLNGTVLHAPAAPIGKLFKSQRYQLINIGSSTGGDYTTAYSLNDAGQVVGAANTSPGSRYSAYVYDVRSGMRFLPSLPGAYYTDAESINRHGQIVGNTVISNVELRAVMWTAEGEVISLHPGPEWDSSHAFNINDRGVVVGLARAGAETISFLYDAVNGYRFLTNVSVTAINTRGAWIGNDDEGPLYAKSLDGPRRHFVFPGLYGMSYLIADDGLIVGYYYVEGYQQLCILDPGRKKNRVVTLDKLPDALDAFPLGVNNRRQIAGSSGNRAVVWHRRQPIALNDAIPEGSEWRFLTEAFDINNQGAIAGVGYTTNAVAAFLLVPKRAQD